MALESTPTFTGGLRKRSVRLDLEHLLAFAAGDLGRPLLALGRPGERFGSGYISANDKEWKALATRLVQRASLVLFVRGLSPGTRWELDLLRQLDCWRKVVFIMPPMRIGDDWTAQWAEISAGLAQVDLALPPYDKRGAFFTMARALVKSKT